MLRQFWITHCETQFLGNRTGHNNVTIILNKCVAARARHLNPFRTTTKIRIKSGKLKEICKINQIRKKPVAILTQAHSVVQLVLLQIIALSTCTFGNVGC